MENDRDILDPEKVTPIKGDAHSGRHSQIACERGDLQTAAQHSRSQELGEHTWLPQNPYRYSLSG